MRRNLRAERARKGLSIEQTARELGVHPNTVAAWERGDAEPLGINLIALAKFFDCSPDYLLDVSNDAHRGLVTS